MNKNTELLIREKVVGGRETVWMYIIYVQQPMGEKSMLLWIVEKVF